MELFIFFALVVLVFTSMMWANQHIIRTEYQNEGGTAVIKSQTVNVDLSQNIEVDIPANTTNALITVSIPITSLKCVAFAITKRSGQATDLVAGPVTIKTNSSGSPDDTLSITTTNGVCWSDGDDSTSNPKPLTVAVTALYVTNEGDAVASLVVRAGNDASSSLA